MAEKTQKIKITRKQRLQFYLKRTASFFKLLLRNKYGFAGLSIIIFFAIIALIAPYITLYDPARDFDVGYRRAAPIWLRNLPIFLGGNPNLSVDTLIVNDRGLNQEQCLKEWNITVKNVPKEAISIRYERDIGNTRLYGSGPGCIAITFKRQETETKYGTFKVIFYTEFNYTQNTPPGKFVGFIGAMANGTTVKGLIPFYNETSKKVEYKESDVLATKIEITVFIEEINGKKWTIWPKNPVRLYELPTDWKTPIPAGSESTTSTLNSEHIEVLQRPEFLGKPKKPTDLIFANCPRTYRFGVELTFYDERKELPVETTVYLDDIWLDLKGTAFGLLGTDNFGRDLFSQLVYGARVSLYVGLLSSILSVGIGLIVGLTAGYLGKIVDEFLMRISDILLVLPGLPLLIVLAAVLGAKLENLILMLGFLGWMGFAKMVRAQVLSLRERPFVEAAKAVGASSTRIIFTHILPNVVPLIYVSLATSVPGAITAEASLSWLGFADPTRVSWGKMLHDAMEATATTNWWWIIPPGLCIAALAVAFVFLGFALDAILNPKLRERY